MLVKARKIARVLARVSPMGEDVYDRERRHEWKPDDVTTLYTPPRGGASRHRMQFRHGPSGLVLEGLGSSRDSAYNAARKLLAGALVAYRRRQERVAKLLPLRELAGVEQGAVGCEQVGEDAVAVPSARDGDLDVIDDGDGEERDPAPVGVQDDAAGVAAG